MPAKKLPPAQSLPAHVIIIQADDLGYDDLGISGNPLVRTPHLDRLARESVQCSDFTVNSVCAPSRATLLTGRHFLRTGVSHVHGGKDFLHADERTLADVFRQAGWHTGMWGKWHLGAIEGYRPWERGFDEAYMARLYKHEQSDGLYNGKPVRHEDWADDVIFNYAMDFIQRNKSGPSLVYIATMTPHAPLNAPEEMIAPYRELGLSEPLAALYGMVTCLDIQVGRLLDFLDVEGLAGNTLLLFTSDNGPAINQGLMSDEDRRLRKISARRGWKGDLWENGVKAPLFVRWPARLQPSVITAPLDQVDVFPTLLDWCGITLPKKHLPLDGGSIRNLFEAASAERKAADGSGTIFNYVHAGWITSERPYDPVGIPGEYNPVAPETKPELAAAGQSISVREGRFKLLFNPFPPGERKAPGEVLIDLARDPGETTDVSADHPEVARRLHDRLIAWFDEIRTSPHSFTAPVMQLHSDAETVLLAKNPCRVAGPLQNTVENLRGWTRPGMFADYHLASLTGQQCTVTPAWSKAPPDGFEFRVSCGDSRSGLTTGRMGATSDGVIHIPAGHSVLRFELIRIPDPAAVPGDAVYELDRIILNPAGE